MTSWGQQLQQAHSGSWSAYQELDGRCWSDRLPIRYRRSVGWYFDGNFRHELLFAIARPHRRPGRDRRRWTLARWYGRRSWMRQEHAGNSHGSRSTQSTWSHGLWRYHQARTVRWREARHRICFPSLRSILAGRSDRGGREEAIRHHQECVSWSRSLWRGEQICEIHTAGTS